MHYEFVCRACERFTCLELLEGDQLNFKAVLCGFCDSRRVVLTAYYESIPLLVEALREEIEILRLRIEELENEDEEPQDSYVVDN